MGVYETQLSLPVMFHALVFTKPVHASYEIGGVYAPMRMETRWNIVWFIYIYNITYSRSSWG